MYLKQTGLKAILASSSLTLIKTKYVDWIYMAKILNMLLGFMTRSYKFKE